MSWLSTELIEFCNNAVIPSASSQLPSSTASQPPPNQSTITATPIITSSDDSNNSLTSVENPIVSSSNITSNNSSSSEQTLIDLRNNLNMDINNALKNFMLLSMSKSVKNEHYQELEELLIKFTRSSNCLTVNKAYKTNTVFQATITKDKFPSPWLNNDPQFVQGFDDLIKTFQTAIQDYNINYISDMTTKQKTAVNVKIDFIKKFDADAADKCKVLEDKVTNDLKKSLTKSIEKVNRLIAPTPQSIQHSAQVYNNIQHSNNTAQTSNKTSYNHPPPKPQRNNNNSNNYAGNLHIDSTTGRLNKSSPDYSTSHTRSALQPQFQSSSIYYGPPGYPARQSYYKPSNFDRSHQNQHSLNHSNPQFSPTNNYRRKQ